MAPVVRALDQSKNFENLVCLTGQHMEMLSRVTDLFDIQADYSLDVMTKAAGLTAVTSQILNDLKPVIEDADPDLILVHGDTTTAMAGAVAGFYAGVPIGHVEAGLRSGNMQAPWPEEGNRRIVDTLTNYHFAPTQSAKENLLVENFPGDTIFVTGNTVIDALFYVRSAIQEGRIPVQESGDMPVLDPEKKLILVTGHRRENFGSGMVNLCESLIKLAERSDVEIIYPVHLNPNVKGPVFDRLSARSNIHLIDPLGYAPFINLMDRAYFIITDSGGIQEEAPSLGKPILVTREVTERPEAVTSGVVKLVGNSPDSIIGESLKLLTDPDHYSRMANAQNPYGDGLAAERIVSILTERLAENASAETKSPIPEFV